MNTKYEYLFIAEAMNGNIIKQTPDDKSILNPKKSAFYDVLQNLPLITFALVGKGHSFVVDFTDLSISVDGNKQFCPRPPIGSTITPIYYHDTIQVAKNTLSFDRSILSKLMKVVLETSPLETTKGQFHIGFQAHYPNPINGKQNAKYEMTIG